MTIRNLLLEQKTPSEIIKILQKDCGFAIRQMQKCGSFLYRGVFDPVNKRGIIKRKTRKSRQSKDTPERIHKLIGQVMKKKFGWNPRAEGVFVSSSEWIMNDYGIEGALIFPIGKFKYVYSPKIRDLWSHLNIEIPPIKSDLIEKAKKNIEKITKLSPFRNSPFRNSTYEPRWKDLPLKELRKVIEDWVDKEYTDKNFCLGIKMSVEISIECDEYYMVAANYKMIKPIAIEFNIPYDKLIFSPR